MTPPDHDGAGSTWQLDALSIFIYGQWFIPDFSVALVFQVCKVGLRMAPEKNGNGKKKSIHELDATVQRRFIRRKHFTNVNCSFHPTIAATLSTVNDVEKMDASLGEGKITNRKRPA